MSERPVDPREQDVALLREILAFSSFKGAPGSDGEAALARLVDALEAAERERDDRAEDAVDRSLEYLRVTADLQVAEARVVQLEAQLREATDQLWEFDKTPSADIALSMPAWKKRFFKLRTSIDQRLAAASVADSGPAPEPCWCCGEPAPIRGEGDPWEGRMDGYCDSCATTRCDTTDSTCAVKTARGPEEKKP